MLEVIGFLFLGWIFIMLCATWFMCALNNLGTFNVGGVENSKTLKFWTIVAGIVIGYYGYWLASMIDISFSK